jgi:hypothetical protein
MPPKIMWTVATPPPALFLVRGTTISSTIAHPRHGTRQGVTVVGTRQRHVDSLRSEMFIRRGVDGSINNTHSTHSSEGGCVLRPSQCQMQRRRRRKRSLKSSITQHYESKTNVD